MPHKQRPVKASKHKFVTFIVKTSPQQVDIASDDNNKLGANDDNADNDDDQRNNYQPELSIDPRVVRNNISVSNLASFLAGTSTPLQLPTATNKQNINHNNTSNISIINQHVSLNSPSSTSSFVSKKQLRTFKPKPVLPSKLDIMTGEEIMRLAYLENNSIEDCKSLPEVDGVVNLKQKTRHSERERNQRLIYQIQQQQLQRQKHKQELLEQQALQEQQALLEQQQQHLHHEHAQNDYQDDEDEIQYEDVQEQEQVQEQEELPSQEQVHDDDETEDDEGDVDDETEEDEEEYGHQKRQRNPRQTQQQKQRQQQNQHNSQSSFFCQQLGCGKSFPSLRKLRHHVVVHSDEFPFVCQFEGCGKKFKRKFGIDLHSTTHFDLDAAMYSRTSNNSSLPFFGRRMQYTVCKPCKEKFKTVHEYQNHMLKHGKEPFKCPVKGCGQKFNIWKSFQKHRASHYFNYYCNMDSDCNHHTSNLQLLKLHIYCCHFKRSLPSLTMS